MPILIFYVKVISVLNFDIQHKGGNEMKKSAMLVLLLILVFPIVFIISIFSAMCARILACAIIVILVANLTTYFLEYVGPEEIYLEGEREGKILPEQEAEFICLKDGACDGCQCDKKDDCPGGNCKKCDC